MQFNMIIVPNATDPIVTFVHSMVPHHINAIQMCKTLMQTGLEDDAFLALCWNIVNTQSLQIMEMNEYLASNSIPEGESFEQSEPRNEAMEMCCSSSSL